MGMAVTFLLIECYMDIEKVSQKLLNFILMRTRVV